MNAGDGENESDSMMRSSGVSGGVYGRPGQGVGRPINKRNFFLVVVVVFVIGMFGASRQRHTPYALHSQLVRS